MKPPGGSTPVCFASRLFPASPVHAGVRPDYRRSYSAFPLRVDRSLATSPGDIGSVARFSTESARTRRCRSAMAAMDHATRKGQPYPRKRMRPVLSWKWVWANEPEPGNIAPAAEMKMRSTAKGPATVCQTSPRARRSAARVTRGNTRACPATTNRWSDWGRGLGMGLPVCRSRTATMGPSARGFSLGARTTERGASTGIRGPPAPSSIFRAKVARALDSRRVSLLAAREARIRVAIVAVDSVAVYTWAETAEVNQGAFVPVAVSQARSAMPAKRMPKKTVRTKGHRRLLPVASNEARSSRGSASPYHAIECPQDHAQRHPGDGPWNRVEEGRGRVRRDRHRDRLRVPGFRARRVHRCHGVEIGMPRLDARVAVHGRCRLRDRRDRESRVLTRGAVPSIDVIAGQRRGRDRAPRHVDDPVRHRHVHVQRGGDAPRSRR